MTNTLIQQIAQALQSRDTCVERGMREPASIWRAVLRRCEDELPRGSGFDSGTKIEDTKNGAIRFTTSFHHMDEHGGYCGWSDHIVTVRPSFSGIDVTVSGRNVRDIKDYIADAMHHALMQDCPETCTYGAVVIEETA